MSAAEASTGPSPSAGAGLTGRAYLRLILLGAAVGIPAGLIAAVFLGLVHELENLMWDDLPDALGRDSPPWYLILGLPLAGAAIVAVARIFLPGDGGHEPLGGISTAPTPIRAAPGVALAAVGTLAFGAVLGPEMPVIALGSVVGMLAAHWARLGERASAVISTAGSFSAVSALFGGPLVAGILLVEAGAGAGMASLLPILLPGFVAAAVGYTIFVGFGDWGGLDTPGLTVPHLPRYETIVIGDLAVAIAIGIVGALVVIAVRALARRVDAQRARLGVAGLLLAGGLAVGLLTLAAEGLGADSQEVLFSGQSSLPQILAEDSTSILLLVVAAKFLAYAVSLGCGFRGGPIFPAIFLGVALSSLAVVWFDTSPTLALMVGTAAGMAAQTRLLVSPILFAALIAGLAGAHAVPAAVLAAAAAWVTVAAFDARAVAAAEAPTGGLQAEHDV